MPFEDCNSFETSQDRKLTGMSSSGLRLEPPHVDMVTVTQDVPPELVFYAVCDYIGFLD
jgi:hypothetical protein